MASVIEFDVKSAVLSNGIFGKEQIDQIVTAIGEDFSQFSVLRDGVSELEIEEEHSPATSTRLGVCYYLLGRFDRALQELTTKSDGGAVAQFYIGRCYAAKNDHNNAIDYFQKARLASYDEDFCKLAEAEVRRLKKDNDGAIAILDDMHGPIGQTAEYLYQRGATVAASNGNPEEVIALYEKAVEIDESHSGALFGLAVENDRRGNDDLAMDLYRRSASTFPSRVGVLLNLGLLYEDHNQYDRAQQCYNRILEIYPDEPRAHLYLQDAIASDDQYFDLDAQKAQDRLAQVLNIPVTDFELSVRSRNCLAKMGVATLGDLARTTEQELLASKNFGETSLIEIREMLSAKNLELGMLSHEAREEVVVDRSHLSPEEAAVYDRPVSDLNLSVRARKCMVRLRINMIGELLRKTGDELLESKNFGVTSLNEVREKLTAMNLKLRGE